jgi:membrane protein DedA with SNARE-associated domain
MIESLVNFLTGIVSSASYVGVVFLMTLESCNLPLPSELIMTYSGFLVSEGKQNFWIATLSGATGCTVGSLLSYWLGAASENSWIKVWLAGWGRIFITPEELERAERWMSKYGSAITFVSRLLPIIRGYISFPAGVARINLVKFTIYTFIGSFIWCALLVYIGAKLGQHWSSVSGYFRQFDLLIVVTFIVGVVWIVYRHLKHFKKSTP